MSDELSKGNICTSKFSKAEDIILYSLLWETFNIQTSKV